MEKIEEWKPIPGAEAYEISNMGKVRFCKSKRYQQTYVNNGYEIVRLMACNKNVRIHRAVALAFIPNPENKPQVNHIDGNKLNNNVENLEWTTASENMQHYYNNEKKPKRVGIKVYEGDNYLEFDSIGEAALAFDINPTTFWGYSLNGKYGNWTIERIIINE